MRIPPFRTTSRTPSRTGFGLRAVAALCALQALAAGPAWAKIDLSTLPERGDVELTIYNSADLTLARETRPMAFKAGENPLQFSWANTLIDPTSVHLRLAKGDDFLTIQDISYPANSANTLIWTIDADRAGEGVVEITYFTSGITWAADYVAKANQPETEMRLEGYVRVTNNSGEDYLNAKTRLLVGDINLVEAIAVLARSGGMSRSQVATTTQKLVGMAMPQAPAPAMAARGNMMMADEMMAPKDVAKEGVSEYFLFTIEGREDLENGLSKRLPSFAADEVPFKLTYKYDPRRFGPSIAKLYKAVNDEKSKLGDSPLPNGYYQVFADSASGGLGYLGRHDDKYIPIGEDLEINLGKDGLVSFEDVRRRFLRDTINYSTYGDVQGWNEIEEREIVLRNSKKVAVPVEVSLLIQSGDFDFKPSKAGPWTKISETEQELKATIEPLSEARFAYTVVRRQGSNAKK
jgi:hypothetical protein